MIDHTRLIPISAVAAVLAVLTLAGCTTLPWSNSGINATSIRDDVAASGIEKSAASDIRPEGLIGPLDEFRIRIFGVNSLALGRGGAANSIEADPQEIAQQMDQVEALREDRIAACMHEQGFDYLPRSAWLSARVTERPAGTWISRESREWAERFGFGLSTANFEGIDQDRFVINLVIDHEVEQHDREYRESTMSAAEQDAFFIALEGDADFIDALIENDHEWRQNIDTREGALQLGCRNFAHWEETRFPEGGDPFSGIREALQVGFPRLMESDPRVQALDIEWAQCMMGKGYPDWAKPGQARNAIRDEVALASEPFDAELHITWDWYNYPEGPPQVDMSELRAREIRVAVASWDCRDQINYDISLREIDLELQEEFVNQHWLALEDWARAIESGEISQQATGQMMTIFTSRRFN